MKYAKVIIVTLFCIGFVLGSVSLAFGQGGAPPYAGLNYEKIALLKWYPPSRVEQPLTRSALAPSAWPSTGPTSG